MLGATPVHGADVEAFEDVQHLQDGDALAVRRQLEHLPAAIRRCDGLDPLRAMRREILAAEVPAVAAHGLLDGGGDGAVVERGAPVVGDELVGARERGIRERLADRGHAAVRHEDRGEARRVLQRCVRRPPTRRR